MRIYLDTCCWNRLFDRPQIGRVKLETDAVLEILSLAEQGDVTLIWSSIIEYEINNNPNIEIADAIKIVAKLCECYTGLGVDIIQRAETLTRNKIGYYDALHVACAEKYQADIFATVDDILLKRLTIISTTIQPVNPLTFILQRI